MSAQQDLPAHVLVVDDDQDVLEALTDALAEQGYSVSAARDGIEALEAIRERRPDLVVTDLMMPSMNGWELIGALHADPDLASIPTLIISAAREPRLDKALPVLAKPLNLGRLLTAIDASLSGAAKLN